MSIGQTIDCSSISRDQNARRAHECAEAMPFEVKPYTADPWWYQEARYPGV